MDNEYIFIPIIKNHFNNIEFLTDSKGKTRLYKTMKRALSELEIRNDNYDYIYVYKLDDVVERKK